MSEELTPEKLQELYESEVENAKKLRKRAQEAETERAALAEQISTLQSQFDEQQQAVEQAKLESEGKYREALDSAQAKYKADLSAREAELQGIQSALHGAVGTNALLENLGKAGVKSELIPQAAKLLRDRVKVSVTDGKAVVAVLGDDGQPMTDGEGNSLTVDMLAKQFAETNPHFVAASGDSGSGGKAGAGIPGGTTQASLRADPKKLGEFLNSHGRDAYLKLPPK
jgi:hypothetical protein